MRVGLFLNKNRFFFFFSFFNVQTFPSLPIASLCQLNRACKLQMDGISAALAEYKRKSVALIKAHTTITNS